MDSDTHPPKVVVFDCDGVLADTERDGHRVSFNKVFGEKELGFEWAVEEYGRLCEVGGGCASRAARVSPSTVPDLCPLSKHLASPSCSRVAARSG